MYRSPFVPVSPACVALLDGGTFLGAEGAYGSRARAARLSDRRNQRCRRRRRAPRHNAPFCQGASVDGERPARPRTGSVGLHCGMSTVQAVHSDSKGYFQFSLGMVLRVFRYERSDDTIRNERRRQA